METVKIEKYGRFTIATIRELVGSRVFTGIGIARCSDGDSYKRDIAEKIATGRAVNALEMKKKGKAIHNMFMG